MPVAHGLQHFDGFAGAHLAKDDAVGYLLTADAAWANPNRPLQPGALILVPRPRGPYPLPQLPPPTRPQVPLPSVTQL